MTTKKPADTPEQPTPPVSEHTGSQPTETADGILWGPAVPVDGGVRVRATFPDGIIVTLDANDQAAARKALRAYHTPKGA